MLLGETVSIPICGNRKFWEDKGYEIPTIRDYWGRKSVKRGTLIEVKIKDLPPKSRTKVARICDCCGEIDEVRWYAYRDFCLVCGNKLFPKEGYSLEEVRKIFEENGCKLISDKYIRNDELLKYICQCGKESEIRLSNFLMGQRCGCVRSFGESRIEEFLKINKINFINQKMFDNCCGKRKKKLPFDFYLVNYNICVEYDGKHHFEPVRFGGISLERAKQNFEITKTNDSIKDKYCLDNNITLSRISYKDNIIEKLNEFIIGGK